MRFAFVDIHYKYLEDELNTLFPYINVKCNSKLSLVKKSSQINLFIIYNYNWNDEINFKILCELVRKYEQPGTVLIYDTYKPDVIKRF